MQAENSVDFRILQDAVLDHELRSCRLIGAWHAFFRRLKDELDGSRQAIAQLRQYPCRRQEDRHVRVVPARVHHADVLPLVLRRGFAGERQVCFLAHRKSVHIRPQTHNGTGAPAFEDGHHTIARDTGLSFEAETLQPFDYVFGSRRLPV